MAKLKSFNIPVICSWNYAVVCASLKGTLMYSYFPTGEVKAVFGMVWYLAQRSNVEKYFAPFSGEKMSQTLGIGQMNSPCYFVESLVINY